MAMKIAAALIDLSGTLHIEDAVIPGAVEALRRLRQFNVRVKFVTNTTKESLSSVHNRLSKLGFDIRREELFTSLTAARKFIERSSLRPFLLLEESAKEDFVGIAADNPNAVVVGLAPSQFHYSCLNEAFRLLLGGAQLIAIHKGKYYRQRDGLSLGPENILSKVNMPVELYTYLTNDLEERMPRIRRYPKMALAEEDHIEQLFEEPTTLVSLWKAASWWLSACDQKVRASRNYKNNLQ